MKLSKKSLSIVLAASTLFVASPSMFGAGAMFDGSTVAQTSVRRADPGTNVRCFIKPKGVSVDSWKKLFGRARTAYKLNFNGVSYGVPYLMADNCKLKFDNYPYNMGHDERVALGHAFECHGKDTDLSNWEEFTDSEFLSHVTVEDFNSTLDQYVAQIRDCYECIKVYLLVEEVTHRYMNGKDDGILDFTVSGRMG